ncbi:hypothetical protein C8R48DRAFT_672095 [Suillus tomentosus]|nr:hypothetical protein C8R48DRAFT_672095 [Suillus tomentosus]
MAPLSNPCGPSSDGSFDEPITAGVRRQRVDSGAGQGYPVALTPRSTKHLKVYANQVAEEVGVPVTSLHEFVDMLVRIVALMLKNDGEEKLKLITNLKELLSSKDFKSALHNCLTACMLSPNITAYVTDTHPQILDFIKRHQEVFKVPALLFEDAELTAAFAKVVSESLSTIRGNMKTKTSQGPWLMAVLKLTQLIGTGSRFCNLMRLAALLACLPTRHLQFQEQVRQKIGLQLGIDIDEIERGMLDAEEDDGGADDTNGSQDTIVASPRIIDGGDAHDNSESISADVDCDKDDADFEPSVGNLEGIKGDDLIVAEKAKPDSDLYTAGRFWNFVDSSLMGARNAAKEQAMADKGPAFEKAYSDFYSRIFLIFLEKPKFQRSSLPTAPSGK